MDVLIGTLAVLVGAVLYIAGTAVVEMVQRHRHRRAVRASRRENPQ